MTDKSVKYRTEIQQMMFVSGENAEPSAETTTLVEHIVKQQVQEMLRRAIELSNRRGQRQITQDDLMFLYRQDKEKLNRLLHFLQWKDVRKNLSEGDERGGDAGVDIGEAELGAASGPPGPTGQNTEPKKTAVKKARITLPWDVTSYFNVQVPPRDDEDDEEEREMNEATLKRLKTADERTRNMSREDYMHWSECRQASFTYRKGKRFREWIGMDAITGGKPNDDVMDIMGFLTFEMVQTITEEALAVKRAEDLYKKEKGLTETADGENKQKRKREAGLFDGPEEEREPVEPRHIHEAFRKLQQPSRMQRSIAGISRKPPPNNIKLI